MKIILAKSAGFCFGVDRAVKMAVTAGSNGPAYTLGPIIHNKFVAQKLADQNVYEASTLSDVKLGTPLIISSHGVSKSIYDETIALGHNVVDTTCPYVKRIHKIVESSSAEGRPVIIIGDKNHTEVRGIAGWCLESYVVDNLEELGDLVNKLGDGPLTVVSQTTVDRDFWEDCVNFIKKVCTNTEIFDTICGATISRQSAASDLASECDAMIIIGDKRSANTKRLFELCRRRCAEVKLIESADELNPKQFALFTKVGITAGASTPKWIIEEVCKKMSEEIKNSEIVNDAVETEAITTEPEREETFAELLEKSIKTLTTGEKVTGIVTGMSNTEIFVDLGTKHAGYIPVTELSNDPSVKVEDILKVGDEIETYVMRVNDVEGTALLSKKRLDTVKGWEEVEDAVDSKVDMEGIVVEENKGGVVVSVKGVRVFVPASQTGIPKGSPLSVLLKTTVKLRIIEVNRARRRVVGSIRAAYSDMRRELSQKVWEEIEVGKEYKGTVKSLTSFGAFVDIGGVDGMVHVSELSWKRVRQPSDVVSVGDEVDVHVISFDQEKKRISLGMRKAEDNPWNKFTTAFNIGDVIKAKVVKLMPFGAFAEIIPGVDGLVHISQISDRRIGKPGDVLAEGQEIDCKITNIDNENQKVWLSIRALFESASASSESEQGADLQDEIVAVSEDGVLEINVDTEE